MATDRALIVLPTYNEAANLGPLVADILALGLGLHLLVVDDSSPDGTGEIADRLAERHAEVHVLHRPAKLGLGTAYIEGFRWACEREYTYILEMDCDYSHHPRYLSSLLEQARDADLVIGSRYVPGGGTVHWGLVRRAISAGGNTFARTLLGLRTHDCTGGYRCYRRSTIQRVPWSEIRLRGYGFQIGSLYHVERMGARVTEVPILFEDRRVGQSKMSGEIVIEAFRYVLLLALRSLARRPPPGSASHSTPDSLPAATDPAGEERL